ncbi:hypothetical protein MYCTH_2313755 [Thermothelomyces thermophilus ATCC 42464]|uniref:Uncharacterized protein n=1 Tax=Thermothelomyces thermophilus (strain ATCC 42464 / BCRC 31852 / DSM 1799) TaxID=573729 RepID=G2Q2R9_THET4|nr:uncharacterized protein MYCTH_2313755 [Thermothelomyces thermophilus ATCC 42464]AEO54286.1 hypothetical protein MYCTH_2313755 [Thermothelomyces thermophilus ATCC 42464]
MGTRHLICVFWKGKWVLAQYGQFDGYPEGQGVKIFNFLSYARNIDNLKAGLDHYIYEPTKEELDAIWAECDAWDENRLAQGLPYQHNMFGINQLYPSLARETSAGILGIIARASQTGSEDGTDGSAGMRAKKVPVSLDLEFANETLFCEWAYVIDLDKEILEIYGGGEHKHDGHRFKDVGSEDAPVPAFICSFSFSELYLMRSAEEFLDKVREAIDEQSGADEPSDIIDGEGNH